MKNKYKVIDNYTGEIRETTSKRMYNNIVEDLKDNYTKKSEVLDVIIYEPKYTLQIRQYIENNICYTIATFY